MSPQLGNFASMVHAVRRWTSWLSPSARLLECCPPTGSIAWVCLGQNALVGYVAVALKD